MFENLSIGFLTLLQVVIGPVLLAAALIYGIIMYRRRSQAAKQRSDQAARRLYQAEAKDER